MEYIIIHRFDVGKFPTDEMKASVQLAILGGWRPLGGVSSALEVMGSGAPVFHLVQAMTREEESKP